jgi:hypothetical protein
MAIARTACGLSGFFSFVLESKSIRLYAPTAAVENETADLQKLIRFD